MIDEVALVSLLSAANAEGVLERSERAYPSTEFDEDSPDCGRNVHVNEFRPSAQKKSAEYDEEYETDMNNDDEIRENAIDHVTPLRIRAVKQMVV